MITQNESGLSQADYDALYDIYDNKDLPVVAKVELRQYAPQWYALPNFPTPPGASIDVYSYDWIAGDTSIKVLYPDVSDNTRITSLTYNQALGAWSSGTLWDSNFPLTGLSVGEGIIEAGLREQLFFVISGTGVKCFNIVFEGGTLITWTNTSLVAPAFIAGVKSDTAAFHIIGTTPKGNWRLGYGVHGTTNIMWSDIYWPYQVRSMDAVRFPERGYDVVIMSTDLPPLVDVSSQGTKTTVTEQRVQGLVGFKYDYATGHWSDHFVIDQIDNQSILAVGSARVTSHTTNNVTYAYLTYSRLFADNVVLAISKSADGVNWQAPLYYDGMGDFSMVSEVQPICLVRNTYCMTLVGGGVARQSVATDFMGDAAPAAIQDITKYVTGLSVQSGLQRSATVSLSIPTGDTIPLLDLKRMLRAKIEYGYFVNGHAVTTPALIGLVTSQKTTRDLPTIDISLSVKDTSVLPQLVGISEAREWENISFHGDNFAPTVEDDTLGTSGLGHVAAHTGTWTGGTSSAKDVGLKLVAEATEGFAMSTSISRAMKGTFSSEMSVYKPLEAVNMGTGAISKTLVGGEYGGLAFHAVNQHQCWYIKFLPASSGNSTVQLVKRVPVLIDGSTLHADYTITPDSWAAPAHTGAYSVGYSGRVSVEWRYNLIRVYHNYPGQTSVKIIEYEALGMGNTGVNNPIGGSLQRVALEGGLLDHPYTSGGCAYLGYSPDDGYVNVLTDGGFELNTALFGYYTGAYLWDDPAQGITGGRKSGFQSAGSWALRVTSDQTLKTSGVFVKTTTGQAISANTVLRFRGKIYIVSGDPDAKYNVYARVHYPGENATRPNEPENRHIIGASSVLNGSAWEAFDVVGPCTHSVDWLEIYAVVENGPHSANSVFYLDESDDFQVRWHV